MNLADLSKLPPAMQRAVMADQARATAARERIFAQAGEQSVRERSSPTPAVKTPRKPFSVAVPWLPAAVLHAIPHPNYGSPSGAQPESPVLDQSLGSAQGETLYAG